MKEFDYKGTKARHIGFGIYELDTPYTEDYSKLNYAMENKYHLIVATDSIKLETNVLTITHLVKINSIDNKDFINYFRINLSKEHILIPYRDSCKSNKSSKTNFLVAGVGIVCSLLVVCAISTMSNIIDIQKSYIENKKDEITSTTSPNPTSLEIKLLNKNNDLITINGKEYKLTDKYFCYGINDAPEYLKNKYISEIHTSNKNGSLLYSGYLTSKDFYEEKVIDLENTYKNLERTEYSLGDVTAVCYETWTPEIEKGYSIVNGVKEEYVNVKKTRCGYYWFLISEEHDFYTVPKYIDVDFSRVNLIEYIGDIFIEEVVNEE